MSGGAKQTKNKQDNPESDTAKGLPPYHIFEVHGEYFLFDTKSYRYYQISQIAFLFLTLNIGQHSSEETIRNLQQYGFSCQEIQKITDEMECLNEAGLFDSPNCKLTNQYLEHEIISKKHDFTINTLSLAIAEDCNLACSYCYCHTHAVDNTDSNKRMSKTIALRAVEWLFAHAGVEKNLK